MPLPYQNFFHIRVLCVTHSVLICRIGSRTRTPAFTLRTANNFVKHTPSGMVGLVPGPGMRVPPRPSHPNPIAAVTWRVEGIEGEVVPDRIFALDTIAEIVAGSHRDIGHTLGVLRDNLLQGGVTKESPHRGRAGRGDCHQEGNVRGDRPLKICPLSERGKAVQRNWPGS
ncbi:uncharacterized protein LKV04_021449 isoform 2-T2 [Tautogolabrus adspersus]